MVVFGNVGLLETIGARGLLHVSVNKVKQRLHTSLTEELVPLIRAFRRGSTTDGDGFEMVALSIHLGDNVVDELLIECRIFLNVILIYRKDHTPCNLVENGVAQFHICFAIDGPHIRVVKRASMGAEEP